MFYEYTSLLPMSRWPGAAWMRFILLAGALIVSITVFIPKSKKPRWVEVVYWSVIGFSALTFGMDYLGHPLENLAGFSSLENANQYYCGGTIVKTVEGENSTLGVIQTEVHYSSGTAIITDLAVYAHRGNRWLMPSTTNKAGIIIAQEKAEKYTVDVLKAKESSDCYIVIRGYDDSANISCPEADEMRKRLTEIGGTFWYGRCEGFWANGTLHIEIQGEDGLYQMRLQGGEQQ